MTLRLKLTPFVLAAGGPLLLSACAHVKVDPIEVKEIHIVHDVNIHVDKELKDFFAFEDEQQRAATQAATTQMTNTAPAAGDVQ
jgi:hypothetical protein